VKQSSKPLRSVTLISPAPPYCEELRHRPGPLTRMQRLPRLGLLALEAVTPPDWEVIIRDERVETIAPEEIESPIVGITVMTYMAPRALALARQLKARGKTIVLGGYFPTLTPELALADPSVDSIVIGRGEHAWPLLLADFAGGRLRRSYHHPFGHHGYKLPAVNCSLTGPERGYNGWLTQVQTGMGCKFHCRFCAIPLFHSRQFALRDLDDVSDEVAAAPGRRIYFVDDNLLNQPAYLEKLCDRLRPLRKGWSGQLSMDIWQHRRLLKKMGQSGCFWIHTGIESIEEGSLRAQGKKQNMVEHYLDTLNMIRDQGISVSAGMMFGFPTDSASVFETTEAFLDRAALDSVSFHYYTPYPGSPDYNRLQAADQLITRQLDHYDTYHAVVRTNNFTTEELTDKVEALKQRFYRPQQVLKRMLHRIGKGDLGIARTFVGGAMGYRNLRQGLPLHP
jgi:radical SAM superfamily enzyme YgiQ (UPF0313 family)